MEWLFYSFVAVFVSMVVNTFIASAANTLKATLLGCHRTVMVFFQLSVSLSCFQWCCRSLSECCCQNFVNCLHNLEMCQIVFVFFFFFFLLQIFTLWFYFVSYRDSRPRRFFFPYQFLFQSAHSTLQPLCKWLNANGFRVTCIEPIHHISLHERCCGVLFLLSVLMMSSNQLTEDAQISKTKQSTLKHVLAIPKKAISIDTFLCVVPRMMLLWLLKSRSFSMRFRFKLF